MTTGTHQPPRAGMVSPRRNAPQPASSEPEHYDSREIPVLIRLPDLSGEARVDAQVELARRHRVDTADDQHQRRTHQKTRAEVTVTRQPANSKLLIGGVVAGVLVLGFLFLSNGRSPRQDDSDSAWSGSGVEPNLFVDNLDISIPGEDGVIEEGASVGYEAPPLADASIPKALSPQHQPIPTYKQPAQGKGGDSFAQYSAYTTENEKQAPEWPTQRESTPLYLSREQPHEAGPVDGWPSDAVMAGPSPQASERPLESGGYGYPDTSKAAEQDYRSSMLSKDPEAYRTGMLDLSKPPTVERESGTNVLDGIIEIPTPTRRR